MLRPYRCTLFTCNLLYNLFLGETEHYRSSEETFDSSYNLFHAAFPEGFHWELIEVLSPPPNVVFKWRHWGQFKGNFKNFSPTGETIEIVGLSVARVTEELKIAPKSPFLRGTLNSQDVPPFLS